jgi:hypothetical protein
MTKMIYEKKHQRKSLDKEKCEIVIKINKLKEKYTVNKLYLLKIRTTLIIIK